MSKTAVRVPVALGLPSAGRDAAWFFAATALAGDVFFVWLASANNTLANGQAPILEVWDIAKIVVAAVALGAVGIRLRTAGPVVFGGGWALVAVAFFAPWYQPAADAIGDALGSGAPSRFLDLPFEIWLEFLVVFTAGLGLSLVGSWMSRRSHVRWRARTTVTFAIVAMSLVFGWYIAAAHNESDSGLVALLVMRVLSSLTVGYTIGWWAAAMRGRLNRPNRRLRLTSP